jgi:SAM-dependent methyltransferase
LSEPLFRHEPLLDIIAFVEGELAAGAGAVGFCALDPDLGRGRYAGELVEHAGELHVHRPLRVWLDLADRLGLRLLTPRTLVGRDGLIQLRFERLDPSRRWDVDAGRERYGAASGYARISKLEDPGFVIDLAEALARTGLAETHLRSRVLDLGVNTGDELVLLERALPELELVGIDHSASAIEVARGRFPRHRLIAADLAALPTLGLGAFDLVLSLNTLQSPGVDDREVLRQVVQHHLAPGGAVILGLPNSRYVDGELSYGARMKNFRQPELGLLIKDIGFYRKYLQQHGRQVFVTGKHYVLVTGVAARPDPDELA